MTVLSKLLVVGGVASCADAALIKHKQQNSFAEIFSKAVRKSNSKARAKKMQTGHFPPEMLGQIQDALLMGAPKPQTCSDVPIFCENAFQNCVESSCKSIGEKDECWIRDTMRVPGEQLKECPRVKVLLDMGLPIDISHGASFDEYIHGCSSIMGLGVDGCEQHEEEVDEQLSEGPDCSHLGDPVESCEQAFSLCKAHEPMEQEEGGAFVSGKTLRERCPITVDAINAGELNPDELPPSDMKLYQPEFHAGCVEYMNAKVSQCHGDFDDYHHDDHYDEHHDDHHHDDMYDHHDEHHYEDHHHDEHHNDDHHHDDHHDEHHYDDHHDEPHYDDHHDDHHHDVHLHDEHHHHEHHMVPSSQDAMCFSAWSECEHALFMHHSHALEGAVESHPEPHMSGPVDHYGPPSLLQMKKKASKSKKLRAMKIRKSKKQEPEHHDEYGPHEEHHDEYGHHEEHHDEYGPHEEHHDEYGHHEEHHDEYDHHEEHHDEYDHHEEHHDDHHYDHAVYEEPSFLLKDIQNVRECQAVIDRIASWKWDELHHWEQSQHHDAPAPMGPPMDSYAGGMNSTMQPSSFFQRYKLKTLKRVYDSLKRISSKKQDPTGTDTAATTAPPVFDGENLEEGPGFHGPNGTDGDHYGSGAGGPGGDHYGTFGAAGSGDAYGTHGPEGDHYGSGSGDHYGSTSGSDHYGSTGSEHHGPDYDHYGSGDHYGNVAPHFDDHHDDGHHDDIYGSSHYPVTAAEDNWSHMPPMQPYEVTLYREEFVHGMCVPQPPPSPHMEHMDECTSCNERCFEKTHPCHEEVDASESCSKCETCKHTFIGTFTGSNCEGILGHQDVECYAKCETSPECVQCRVNHETCGAKEHIEECWHDCERNFCNSEFYGHMEHHHEEHHDDHDDHWDIDDEHVPMPETHIYPECLDCLIDHFPGECGHASPISSGGPACEGHIHDPVCRPQCKGFIDQVERIHQTAVREYHGVGLDDDNDGHVEPAEGRSGSIHQPMQPALNRGVENHDLCKQCHRDNDGGMGHRCDDVCGVEERAIREHQAQEVTHGHGEEFHIAEHPDRGYEQHGPEMHDEPHREEAHPDAYGGTVPPAAGASAAAATAAGTGGPVPETAAGAAPGAH